MARPYGRNLLKIPRARYKKKEEGESCAQKCFPVKAAENKRVVFSPVRNRCPAKSTALFGNLLANDLCETSEYKHTNRKAKIKNRTQSWICGSRGKFRRFRHTSLRTFPFSKVNVINYCGYSVRPATLTMIKNIRISFTSVAEITWPKSLHTDCYP